MSITNYWPFALLILIPGVILLYMIRQKEKEQKVSSTYLWYEVSRNMQADTPWEKLKHNLIMYLQILALLLLIFAMLMPYIRSKTVESKHEIIVLDNSAGMGMKYDDTHTRLEAAQKDVLALISGGGDGTDYTLITVSDSARMVLSETTDKILLEKSILSVKPESLAGSPKNAMDMIRYACSGYDDYEVLIYSDTAVESGNNHILWIDMSSEVLNAAVDRLTYNYSGDALYLTARVKNYSDTLSYEGDVSFFIGETMLDVKKVFVPAGESEYCTTELAGATVDELFADKSSLELHAVISGKDALAEDNVNYCIVKKQGTGRIMLVTEQNTFLENALRALSPEELYISDSVAVNTSEEIKSEINYYDGVFPKELEKNSVNVLFNAVPGIYDSVVSDDAEFSSDSESGSEDDPNAVTGSGVKHGTLSFTDEEMFPLLSGYRFYMNRYETFELPGGGKPFIKDDSGRVVAFTYDISGTVMAVIGFDIHSGELPLETEFPIFIYELNEGLKTDSDIQTDVHVNFPYTESAVHPEGASEKMSETATADKVRTGGVGGFPLKDLLLIAAAAVLVILSVVFIIRSCKVIPIARILAAVCIILAIVGIKVQFGKNFTSTIYLIDVSDSCIDNKKEMEAFVREAMQPAKDTDRQAVIAFGSDTRVEQFLDSSKMFKEVLSIPTSTSTNIRNAFEHALTYMPENGGGRIVLLTDGCENEEEVSDIASQIKARNITVQIKQYEYSNSAENYIASMDMPANVELGDEFLITVCVESNCDTTGLLTLYERDMNGNEFKKASKDITIRSGVNNYAFTDCRETEGLALYRAVLESNDDTKLVNNKYTAFTRASGGSRYLLIEREENGSDKLAQVLDGMCTYDRVIAGQEPSDLTELCEYAGVILDNVPAGKLKDSFFNIIESYVSDFGGGLITTGGNSSYALGKYEDTVLEKILPVDMEIKNDVEIPSMSMVFVIDHSGSMEGNDPRSKLGIARSSAINALDNLRAIDKVGVLAFDDKYTWMQHLTSAADINQAKRAVGQIGPGGGTSIYPALYAATVELENPGTDLKHIILLTDGEDEFNNYSDLIARLDKYGITLSTVAIGEGANYPLLRDLADKGYGRSYSVKDIGELPEIFAQEVILSLGDYAVNRDFYPVVTSDSDVLLGVVDNGVYMLKGFVNSTAKNNAKVLLRSDEDEPILSSMRYGLGNTVSLMIDTKYKWSANLAGTPEYTALWKNLLDHVKTDIAGEGSVVIKKSDGGATVSYRTNSGGNGRDLHIAFTDSNGVTREAELIPVGAGRYETEFELEEDSAYSFIVSEGGKEERRALQMGGIALQYGKEYTFGSTSGLAAFAERVKAEYVTGPEKVFASKVETNSESRELDMLFIVLAVVFFCIDIVLRRFGINTAEILAAKIKKKAASESEKKHEKKQGIKAVEEPGHAVQEPLNAKSKASEDILDTSSLLMKKNARGPKNV